MLGHKSSVVTQTTNIQPKALSTHCHCHSLSITVKVLTWKRSSYADDIDVTALKTELLAFKEIFKEKASHFDDIIRALEETSEETISDSRLLFPNDIIVISIAIRKPRHKCHTRQIVFCSKKIQLLLKNPATCAPPPQERSFPASRPGYDQACQCCK